MSVRQPRSAAARRLRALFDAHARAQRDGLPVEEVLRAAQGASRTRRELLREGAGLATGAALAGVVPGRAWAQALSSPTRNAPRIAIVGAGLAGLRCAHLLWTGRPGRPLAASVYDANPDRAGGRCWTLRDYFEAGLVTEHGGSFIDTAHVQLRRLVGQLGLELEVVRGGDLARGQDIYYLDGGYYTRDEASADWSAVGFDAFRTAAREAETPAGERRLDDISVSEWLGSTEIGTSSRLGRLLLANTVTENGADPQDQSALDLIEITAGSPRSTLELLPGDDERYHVRGGNDQIVAAMIAQLPPQTVQHDHELIALRENGEGSITLVFASAGTTVEVLADRVVLALPFSTLRDVDLSASGLSQAKRRVIATMGMGKNAKVHVELARKTWPALGFAGVAYGEWDGFCCAWDDSVPLGPDGSPALLLGFPGGHVGATGLTGSAHGPAPTNDRDWFLSQIEPVFPGTSAVATGRAYEDHWAFDPWVHGAYSYYRVGQAATYGTIAAAAEGPLHFAGEHTSSRFQGFLNGAVESGERAAREILRYI